MLPNAGIVADVCESADGIFKNSKPNSLVIDCSTISPFSVKEIAERAIKVNQRFVDAPVSGGVGAAAAGTLTFMVGATNEEIFKQCSAVLKAMGKNVFNCKEAGAG
jgi:3-hydroxyisobutyrate dehydrogenase